MFGLLGSLRKYPPLSQFNLDSYSVTFSLDHLVPGVDNVHYDVYLSPTFVSATRKIVAQLVARHAGVEKREVESQKKVGWAKEIDSYKKLYTEVMRDALNKAKGQREIQIESLAQTAFIKMLIQEIRAQYDHLIAHLKKAARKSDLVMHDDLAEAPKLKGRVQRILQEGEGILQRVGLEICSFWAEAEEKKITTMHEAVFGQRTPIYADLLKNPLLHIDQPDNEFFMIAEYDVALGRRIEDPDKYDTLLFFIRRLLNQLDLKDPDSQAESVEKRLMALPHNNEGAPPNDRQQAYDQKIESWLQASDNMDRMLNWQRTKAEYQVLRKQNADRIELDRLKQMISNQKTLLDFFYKQFRSNGLMDRVAASYEMQPEYLEYCPPLIPQQIIQYLLLPKSRKVIRNRLNRMKQLYNKTFSLRPLHKKIKAMEQMTKTKYKAYLVRFMNAFARYHRDRSNCELMRDAMERVQIATEEKIITLSRENNTLYEFLLPQEQVPGKAPIINHVVIKADVRGSTDITFQMNERGLNPASFFSLNFFDPISEILAEYDAVKIFIEGDAIILSIFERENTPADWFSVARACGIALNMLVIIQRYNEKSRKHQLPILELGIGISHLNKSPTFLFDGDNRIMISSAINQADRLSSCSKTLRQMFADQRSPYNLHVLQTLSDAEMAATSDDLHTRYNVNGIELNAAGFEKLSSEIDLKPLKGDFTDNQNQKSKLYSGKFPTKSGRYQRLIIREAPIPVLDPATMKVVRNTSRKYYEVCTHPKLYKLARRSH